MMERLIECSPRNAHERINKGFARL